MKSNSKTSSPLPFRQVLGRALEFAFPLTSGLRAIRIDDVVAPTNRAAFELDDWNGDPGAGSLWDLTALILITTHLKPRSVFEIGTGHGRTTLNIALNTAPDASIFTLDISESAPTGKLFLKHAVSTKIKRIVANSTHYDFTQFQRKIDLVLVDGAHHYEAVKADTISAFSMVANNGIIVWDDVHPTFPGVVRALRERPEASRIRRIAGTKLAVYKA